MKNRFVKLTTILNVALLIALLMSISAVAATSESTYDAPTFYVGDCLAQAGESVTVEVCVASNPGILNAVLTLSFDERLILSSIEQGTALSTLDFTPPGKSESGSYNNPCNFLWDAIDDADASNGIVLLLTFIIPDDADPGTVYALDLSYIYGDIADNDLNPIAFEMIDGTIEVVDYTPGDVNNDGRINGTDVTLIRRHITGGYGVSIILDAADVNNDGRINGTDVTLIRRYITGGYGVELKPSTSCFDHKLNKVDAVEPTCSTTGNIEYWQCSNCDKCYSDANGTKEITLNSTVIGTKGHEYSSVVIAPTCTEQGYTTHTCANCEDTYVDSYVDATGHTYSEKWLYDDSHHWHVAICGCEVISNKITHTLDSYGECLVCDFVDYVKLDTPVITNIEYDKVYWTAVDNATNYTITVNDDFTYTTASLSANLSNVVYNGAKIDEHGTVRVTVQANGDGRYVTSDKSSESRYYYVPLTDSADATTATRYKIGYGYNLIEDPYLDTKEYASTNSVLNINKLLTIGKYSEGQGTGGDTTGYYYSSIDDFLLKTKVDVEYGWETGCMLIGSVKNQVNVNAGFDYSSHKYVSTFVGESKVVYNDRRIIDFEKENLVHCMSDIFLKDIRRESSSTEGMTDEQLVAYLYETYGTHVILGVNTGGTYVAQYTIATNSKEIAAMVKAGFEMSTSGGAIDKIINTNFNLDVNLEASAEWKESNTEVEFHTYYYGGTGTFTTNMKDYSTAVSSWNVTDANATAYGLTKDGAINLGYLISAIDYSLGQKFESYVAERTDETYNELFAQFTAPSTLDWDVVVEGNENVLIIDLSNIQQSGSMEDVHCNYMLDNKMTIYPMMKGKNIDKIVITGAFDEYSTKLIDNFSIKLAKGWNKDITIVVENLGVICASDEGIVDRSEVSSVYNIGVEYVGVNAIQETDGDVLFHSSINGINYNFLLEIGDGETIDFTTIDISSILRMPMAQKEGGYQFAGWYDENDVEVTDNKGNIYDTYISTETVTYLYAQYIRVSEGLDYTLNDDYASYSVTSIGSCTDTKVVIPNTYNGLPVTRIGSCAFDCCTWLTSVEIPESVTSVASGAFYDCDSLKSIVIPDSVTSIGPSAFLGCNKLTSIDIPDSVTSIDSYTFDGCTSLTSVVIPASVTSIGDYTFAYCTSLTNINFDGTIDQWNAIEKISGWDNLTASYIVRCSNGIISKSGEITIYGEGLEYTLNDDGKSYSLTGIGTCTDNELIVPSTYNGLPVTNIGSVAFQYCSSLTSIVIPDSVTSIDWGAFYNCRYLTSVMIPNSVTSIGSDAFSECIALTSITFGENSQLTSMGDYTFSGCTSLTSIDIPDSVIKIGNGVFHNCFLLTNVIIGDSVTSIGEIAFVNCYSLTDIVIPNSVTSIGLSAFWQCNALASIEIPDSVTSIGDNVFAECTSLTSVIFGENSQLTSISTCAFYGCTALTSIVIPNSVIIIDEHAFAGCTALKSVEIGDSIISIGYGAFSDCTSLTKFIIPDSIIDIVYEAFYNCSPMMYNEYGNAYYLGNQDNPYVALIAPTNKDITFCNIHKDTRFIINQAFVYCTALTKVVIGDSVESMGNQTFLGCTSLTSVEIGDSVTSIVYDAFRGCTSLTSIVIPNSVTSIDDYSFAGCSSLTSIVIPNSVTGIGDYAFYGCTSLESVKMGDSINSIGEDVFKDCDLLTNIVIPDTITYISPDMLSDCSSLVYNEYDNAYYLGNEDNPYVALIKSKNTDITSCTIHEDTKIIVSNAFSKCTLLASIVIPDSVTSIGEYAFNNCKSLTSVEIGDSVISIGDYAFQSCASLTSVEIGDSVTSIGDFAFWVCTSLTNVEIPNSVTSIGVQAFSDCTSLTNIIIPDSVTSIGQAAFVNCKSLTNATIPDTITDMGHYVFNDCPLLEYNEYSNAYYLGNSDNPFVILIKAKSNDITFCFIHEDTKFVEGSAFEDCTALTNVVIPDSLIKLDSYWSLFDDCSSLVYNEYDNAYYLGNEDNPYVALIKSQNTDITSCNIHKDTKFIVSEAFRNCSSLTSIVIPNSVTSIGNHVFNDCTALTSVEIGDSVTSIGERAFTGCTALTSVEIGDSVTSIGIYAFAGCSSLTSIVIPNSVTSIGGDAFLNKSLTRVFFENPNGWWITSEATNDRGKLIATSNIRNPEMAAHYISYEDANQYWYRIE